MNARESHFNRNLLIVLVIFYLFTLATFSYANWAADPDFMVWWKTLLNIPILSIPLVLLFGSIYVLALACRQHTIQGSIDPRLAKVIRTAPRLAAILIIFFISLFSLDIFEMQASPLQLLGAFLIHNIPSIVLTALLIAAWKRPVVGFVAFLVAAFLFTVFFVRDLSALPNLLFFVLPILMVATLFYADWRWITPKDSPNGSLPTET
jgi:hypothetical protein